MKRLVDNDLHRVVLRRLIHRGHLDVSVNTRKDMLAGVGVTAFAAMVFEHRGLAVREGDRITPTPLAYQALGVAPPAPPPPPAPPIEEEPPPPPAPPPPAEEEPPTPLPPSEETAGQRGRTTEQLARAYGLADDEVTWLLQLASLGPLRPPRPERGPRCQRPPRPHLPPRRCTRCGLTKPAEDFAVDQRRKDGLNGRCRPCESARVREYYERKKSELGVGEFRERQRETQRRHRDREVTNSALMAAPSVDVDEEA